MHCRLVIPHRAAQAAGGSGAASSPGFLHSTQRRLPALELLLARGRRRAIDVGSREQWLLEEFGVDRQIDWPSAPYALLGEGFAPGDGYWMHADPAHFRADRDRVLVDDATALDVSAAEAAAIESRINEHFDGALRLQAVHPNRWYACVAKPPSGGTTPLRDVTEAAVDTAAGSIGWHALMNEIQMLLHAHPVNDEREARGAPVINGVWLWGGGRLAGARHETLRSVLGSDALANGLAKCAGVPVGPLPADARNWLARSAEDGVHMTVLPPLDIGDEAAWQRIEERWAQPLVEALRRGRIGMATLHFDGGDRLWQVEATAADLRRIWRRRRPVAHYFESARAGLDRHRDDGPDEPVRADMERFTRHDVERDAAPGGCR